MEHESVVEGGWQVGIGNDLSGKTLGVIGLGRLGSRVAAVGNAFGMKVVAWSQNLTAERAAEHGAERVELDELLAHSDVVTIHLVLSERTRGLLGRDELAKMKPSAILINTSRGPIVEEQALIDALTRRQIRGAGIDVYAVEPLPFDHPIRHLSNTVLTPHIGYVTEESYRLFYGDMVEDIQAYLKGEPIRVMTPSRS
jgi:phosphoglycerate dehydrogenase-like enzyme